MLFGAAEGRPAGACPEGPDPIEIPEVADLMGIPQRTICELMPASLPRLRVQVRTLLLPAIQVGH
jgi:hypothetical protein